MQAGSYNLDIKLEQIQKLAEIFSEAIREGRVDFASLKATLGADVDLDLGDIYGIN